MSRGPSVAWAPVARARTGWILAGLIALSAVARAAFGLRLDGLWIMPDEAVYGSIGESLYRHGRLAILDGPTVPYSLVYPAIVGLPLTAAGIQHGLDVVKAIQPALMSLVAVPVYLWGRSLMPRPYALLAAALTLVTPALVYAGLLMSVVAYYPLAALALWACARMLETGTRRDQALAVGAIALVVLTRVQGVVFLPAVLTAAGLHALVERRPRLVLRYAPAAAAVVLPAFFWSLWRLVRSGSWVGALGPYSDAGSAGYDAGDVARFVVYHGGEVVLFTGVIPVCAVALLATAWVRGWETSPAVRAYLAVTVSYSAWLLVEVGAFASENAGRLLERNLQTLGPLLFVGFALWLSRGAPRTWLAASATALLVLVPLAAIPKDTLVDDHALPDSFSLAPLLDLHDRFPSLDVAVVVTVVAALLAALFAFVPRRLAAVLPAVVAAWLVLCTVAAARSVDHSVRWEQVNVVGATGDARRWIDHAADGPVAYVFAGGGFWNAVWQQAFWNANLRRVYALPGTKVDGPMPQRSVGRIADDGRLLLDDGTVADEPYVVAPSELTFFGTPLAGITQANVDSRGLTLWRIDPPLRVSTIVTGVKPNGDLVGPAQMLVYGCRGGNLRLTLLTKASSTLDVLLDHKVVRALRFSPGNVWRGLIPAPTSSEPRRCLFEIAPDSLAGTTVLQFER
jgi:hypothetical protein